jgi:hypothetical protein
MHDDLGALGARLSKRDVSRGSDEARVCLLARRKGYWHSYVLQYTECLTLNASLRLRCRGISCRRQRATANCSCWHRLARSLF